MIYRFGAYALDDSARELRRDGALVDTEPKAFELLLYLVQHRDRAVSKDELLNAVWPRQVVTETALSRCVMKARRSVGDDADSQAIIRTLHGHGYRFTADLVGNGSAAPSAIADPPAPTRLSAARWLPAAAATLLIAGVLGWWLQHSASPADPGMVAVLPVTNHTGDAELDWARVGIMSLLARMLEEQGVRVAEERPVLATIGSNPLDAPPDADLVQRLRQRADADSVLYTVLDRRNGLDRIEAVLTGPDGRQVRRIIVGDAPAALAADLANVLGELLQGAQPPPDEERFAKVSTDPFVNELYARALNLELQGDLAAARDMFRLASAEQPELFWLRYEIALCTRDLREWEEAERLFLELHEDARSGADPRALIVTLNSRGVMHLIRNDYAAAEADFNAAFEVAAERGDAEDRATILTNLALINSRYGRVEAAKANYEQALAELDDAKLPPSGQLLNNFAGLLMHAGDLDAARLYSERAIEYFRLHGQRRYEAPSLNRLGKILRRMGDLDGALARHEQALEIYRDLDNPGGALSAMSALTGVYRERGDLTRASRQADDVAAAAEDYGDPLLIADSHMQRAFVDVDLGNNAAARTEFAAAEAIFAGIDDADGLRGARLGLAQAALNNGDVGLAEQLAAGLLAAAVANQDAASEARARWLAGKIAEVRGDAERARELYGEALAYGRASNDRRTLAQAAGSLASMAIEDGRLDAATGYVEELRPLAGRELDFLRLDARLAAATGDRDRAAGILRELRQRAGEAWRTEDDELLASLER